MRRVGVQTFPGWVDGVTFASMTHETPILLATGNPHKLSEIRELFSPSGWSVLGLDELDVSIDEPIEDQPSFAGNAVLKAMHYARQSGEVCLADDSGLVVDALDGAPGVISARYSGVEGPRSVVDPANNKRLIEALQDVPDEQRTARFVCVMALCDGRRTLAQSTGQVEGRIVDRPRGANGFGYDPHFFIPEIGCTTAELDPIEKNLISHRGRAARAMLDALSRIVGPF